MAGIDQREIVRCLRCRLNQFRTVSNFCRRCDFPLPPTPCSAPHISETVSEMAGATGDSARSVSECREQQHYLYSRRQMARSLPIGRKIRELRKGKKLTQHQMASKAGVPRTYISRIENARLLPGPLMLQRIADALHVAILELLPPRRIANGHLPSEADPFWTSLSSYFMQLRPRQMLLVLDRVRDMVAEKPIHSFTPALLAR